MMLQMLRRSAILGGRRPQTTTVCRRIVSQSSFLATCLHRSPSSSSPSSSFSVLSSSSLSSSSCSSSSISPSSFSSVRRRLFSNTAEANGPQKQANKQAGAQGGEEEGQDNQQQEKKKKKNKRKGSAVPRASTKSSVGVLRPLVLLTVLLGMGGLLATQDFEEEQKEDDLVVAIIRRVTYPLVVVYEAVSGLVSSDESLLVPPPTSDEYGQTPRTVVLNFERTLAYPMWTREEGWSLRKRPYVDLFMQRLLLSGYEVIIWSGKNQMDAEHYMVLLDSAQLARHRLFRDHCNFLGGNYVRNISRLGRDLSRVVVVEHNPEEVSSPENVVRLPAFVDDKDDRSLIDLIVFLEGVKRYNISDVRTSIAKFNKDPLTCFDDEENFRTQAHSRLRELKQYSLTDSEIQETYVGRAIGFVKSFFFNANRPGSLPTKLNTSTPSSSSR